jgi:hypothetical protein
MATGAEESYKAGPLLRGSISKEYYMKAIALALIPAAWVAHQILGNVRRARSARRTTDAIDHNTPRN